MSVGSQGRHETDETTRRALNFATRVSDFLSGSIANPSPLVLGLAALFLASFCCRYGERIQVRGGLGWDGATYARWVRDFYQEIFVNRVDTYYIQRILPSAIVHYALRLTGQPLTDVNVMRGFALLSVSLFGVMGYVWGLVAGAMHITPRGRWLGFGGLFLNYVTLKHTFYVPVTTDVSAYCLGMLMIHAYSTGRTFWLAALTGIGAFVWPLSVQVGALLILFPRAENEHTDAPPPWRLHLIAAVVGTIVAMLGIIYAVRTGPSLVHGLVQPLYLEPVRRLLIASYAVAGAYLCVGAAELLRSRRLTDWREYVGRQKLIGLALVIAVVGGTHLCQSVWSNGRHFFGVGEMLAITAQTAVTKPGVFLVTHVAYYGPFFLLAVFRWWPICRLIHRQGVGLTLAVLLAFLLSLNSQSRYWINVFVMVIPFIVKATDDLNWRPAQYGSVIGMCLLFSKFWLPMNGGPYTDRQFEFPDQLMFMTHGPWVSHSMYAVQGAVILATAFVLHRYCLRRRLEAPAP
jgi:hypothetical protein